MAIIWVPGPIVHPLQAVGLRASGLRPGGLLRCRHDEAQGDNVHLCRAYKGLGSSAFPIITITIVITIRRTIMKVMKITLAMIMPTTIIRIINNNNISLEASS